MSSPEPLKGFKYSPWPSVSTHVMFEPSFKYTPFPMALLVAFWASADPTPDSAAVANVGRTVFAKKGKAFAARPARSPRNPPSIFMLWKPEVYSFSLWCLFHPDKLLSFCSFVNWSKQEHHFHTNLRSWDECSRDSLYQQRVSIFCCWYSEMFTFTLV